jgi:hypothetical protein
VKNAGVVTSSAGTVLDGHSGTSTSRATTTAAGRRQPPSFQTAWRNRATSSPANSAVSWASRDGMRLGSSGRFSKKAHGSGIPVSRPPTSRVGPSESTAATAIRASPSLTTGLERQRTPTTTSTSSRGSPR